MQWKNLTENRSDARPKAPALGTGRVQEATTGTEHRMRNTKAAGWQESPAATEEKETRLDAEPERAQVESKQTAAN
jgi:hypothetical protein